MAEFTRQRGKRQEDNGLGSVLDLLLANARLVLGVTGAAVLAIATLAVKRVRLVWLLLGLRTALLSGCSKDALQTPLAVPQLVHGVWQKCCWCWWQHRGYRALLVPALQGTGSPTPISPGTSHIWDMASHQERHLGLNSHLGI